MSSHYHTITPSQIQEIHADTGTVLAEYIRVINSCYPEEIVRYMWGRRVGGGRREGQGRGMLLLQILLVVELSLCTKSISWSLANPEGRVGQMFVRPITKQKPALVNIFIVSMSFTCAGSCRRFNNEWWTNEPKFGYSRPAMVVSTCDVVSSYPMFTSQQGQWREEQHYQSISA